MAKRAITSEYELGEFRSRPLSLLEQPPTRKKLLLSYGFTILLGGLVLAACFRPATKLVAYLHDGPGAAHAACTTNGK